MSDVTGNVSRMVNVPSHPGLLGLRGAHGWRKSGDEDERQAACRPYR